MPRGDERDERDESDKSVASGCGAQVCNLRFQWAQDTILRSEGVWMGRRIQSCVPRRGGAVRGLWGAGIYCAMNGFVDGGLFRTYGAQFPFWLLYHKLRTANAALACGY